MGGYNGVDTNAARATLLASFKHFAGNFVYIMKEGETYEVGYLHLL